MVSVEPQRTHIDFDGLSNMLGTLGAEIVSVSFLIELSFLNGRTKLGNHEASALLTY